MAGLSYLPLTNRRYDRLDWVGSSYSSDREAAVRPPEAEGRIAVRLLPTLS